jgi:hypothetical protein
MSGSPLSNRMLNTEEESVMKASPSRRGPDYCPEPI